MIRISKLIKARRESMGLSLREFAEKCNLSHSYIKNLEDGDPRTGRDIVPTLSSLEKLAPVLSISVEDLLKKIGYINNDERRSFFHEDNKDSELKASRSEGSYKYPTLKEEAVPFLKEDLREFILNPVNEEYIRLAKELSDKKINVKLIRDTLFED